MSIKQFLQQHQEHINTLLGALLPSEELEPKKLHMAMRYAVLSGGKRLRPILVYAVGKTLGADTKVLDPLAAAIELIHASTLVHDDLPAMDNDDFRRGKPTCHKVFGEATAILAGYALPLLAIELISRAGMEASPYADSNVKLLNVESKTSAIETLLSASGSLGVLGGQELDLELAKGNNNSLTIEQLENIFNLKTGKLIQASVKLGMIVANLNDSAQIKALEDYSYNLGLAFQIQDDVLEMENISTDEKAKKCSENFYTALVGIDQAKQRMNNLYQQAKQAIKTLPVDTSLLVDLADYIMQRVD